MRNGYCDQGWDTNRSIGAQWLDELLCEYVDGTMDRVVLGAFEECLQHDIGLAERVERLRCTRLLLCSHRCRAPHDLQSRILKRVEQEMVESDQEDSSGKSDYAGARSIIVTLLVAGMLAGASWVSSPEGHTSLPAYEHAAQQQLS